MSKRVFTLSDGTDLIRTEYGGRPSWTAVFSDGEIADFPAFNNPDNFEQMKGYVRHKRQVMAKGNRARMIMESRLGGITRPLGECLNLPDQEAIATLERWGWVWSGKFWINQPLHDSIEAMERDLDIPPGTLPTRFIW